MKKKFLDTKKIWWGIEIAHVANTQTKEKERSWTERRLTLLFLLLLPLQFVSFDGCLPVPCPRDHDVHCHLEEDAHLSVNFVGIVERVIDWEELDNPQGHSQDTCQQTSEGLLNKPVNIQSNKNSTITLKFTNFANYKILSPLPLYLVDITHRINSWCTTR